MTEIQPALTPEEWAAHRRHQTTPGYDHGEVDDNVRDMALSNDALPAADPRKIRRADVELLESVDLVMLSGGKIPELAAKLAALLPPQ